MDPISFSDERLAIRLEKQDDTLWLQLHDVPSGRLLGRSPLLALEIFDKACRRVERAERYRIDDIERLDDRLHVTVADPRGVRIGLWLRIQAGELAVRLPITEVYEDQPDVFRLFAIDLLPELMSCGADGRLVIPINSGTICSPNGKPKVSDRFLIYGEQSRWELLPLLPVCATCRPDGGLMALATAGACETECRVATDGNGNGRVSLGFHLRSFWPDPVEIETREIRFAPIPPRTDPVLFTAKRLRRHVTEDLGKPTLTARAKESPEAAYLLESQILKLFHAVERVGYMMKDFKGDESPPSFTRVMTFAESLANLKRLHAAGIDRIYTQSVGWNARGHDGWYPARFPIDERLGGERGFRTLIDGGHALGYHMSAHDNFMMHCKRSPAFDPEFVVQDLYGEPLVHGHWAGGVECAGWPLALPDAQIAGHLRRMQALGLRGTYYCDYMAQPLEVNYHPKHRGSRTQCALGMRRVQEDVRNVFGSAGAENGFLHILIPSDHIAMSGGDWYTTVTPDAWPIKPLLEKRVPLWHLALHGLIVHEGQMNSWDALMSTLLMGGAPRDEWSAHPGIMPVLDDARVALLKDVYDLSVKRLGRLRALEMIGYEEPAENVKVSRFEDGTEVVADLGKHELVVNGERIARPNTLCSE